jgi:hypothetical protein
MKLVEVPGRKEGWMYLNDSEREAFSEKYIGDLYTEKASVINKGYQPRINLCEI